MARPSCCLTDCRCRKTETSSHPSDSTAEAIKDVAALNVKVVNAAAGIATIKVDGQVKAQGPERTFAIIGLRPGLRVLRVEVDTAEGMWVLEKAFDLKAEVKEVTMQ